MMSERSMRPKGTLPSARAGRPRWKPSERELGKIEVWASHRLPLKYMAERLGITDRTLRVARKRDASLSSALERGWAQCELHAAETLSRVMDMSERHPGAAASAARFVLRAQYSWVPKTG